MTKHIFILPLEKVPTRYTQQWYTEIPKRIMKECHNRNLRVAYMSTDHGYVEYINNGELVISNPDITIVNVPGDLPEQTATTGAFLNFASTNVWKSTQLAKFADLIHKGLVPRKSKVYITDAWNPAIIQIKYMSDLLDLDLELHGQWHAGAHDPWDFLGRKIIDKRWPYAFECSVFYALDKNYFTTEFYLNMFADTLGLDAKDPKFVRTGYPNEYLIDTLKPFRKPMKERKDIILFPHRIAPEKQVDIFKDLAETMPEYEWIVCQEKNLSKDEYHTLLGESKMVFSAALQETLGIAQTEAIFARSMSLSPERLSYKEMYDPEWLYPSDWTLSFEAYMRHKDKLVKRIKEMMTWYNEKTDEVENLLVEQEKFLRQEYVNAWKIWENLLDN